MNRKILTEEQRKILDKTYRDNHYVTQEEITKTSERLDLAEERVHF